MGCLRAPGSPWIPKPSSISSAPILHQATHTFGWVLVLLEGACPSCLLQLVCAPILHQATHTFGWVLVLLECVCPSCLHRPAAADKVTGEGLVPLHLLIALGRRRVWPRQYAFGQAWWPELLTFWPLMQASISKHLGVWVGSVL